MRPQGRDYKGEQLVKGKAIALVAAAGAVAGVGILAATRVHGATAASAAAPVQTVLGMPPVVDASNVYSETGAGHQSTTVQGHLERVYVPNLRGDTVSVIDPSSMKVVDTLKVGHGPQHVVPS
jgi:YVTN family beta-propeller protein